MKPIVSNVNKIFTSYHILSCFEDMDRLCTLLNCEQVSYTVLKRKQGVICYLTEKDSISQLALRLLKEGIFVAAYYPFDLLVYRKNNESNVMDITK